MDFWAKGRLALTITAAIVFAALTTNPLFACETCPPGPNTQGVAANALPTYPEATEEASEPIALKKFAKSQTRAARRAQPRKVTSSARAEGGKHVSRRAGQDDETTEASARARETASVAPALANANAALVEPDVVNATTAEASETVEPPAREAQADPAPPPAVELVAADEFNALDRAAWEANQLPKLMQLTASDSRAELRDNDSKWAQTSTIGKLFVAFGALLTIGSALRMFMA